MQDQVNDFDNLKPTILVFGVGGAGGNALNNMIESNLDGVSFIAANTDAQHLSYSLAKTKIQLGINLTKGLGAGANPEQGRKAAEESEEDIKQVIKDANMVFIASGMGGGTGTGASPVIAKIAKELGILTVGVVTKPFNFEGVKRMKMAEEGIKDLKQYVDTLIIIPNQNLFRIANEQTTFEAAFKSADKILHSGVRSITDLITVPGLINLDFADITTVMKQMGGAMMGSGEATGENRAVDACQEAMMNPLLDNNISINKAKGVLVNMTGGPDMTLYEADIAVNAIKKNLDPEANIIFGSAFNECMKGKIRISIVATGIDEIESQKTAQEEDKKETQSDVVEEEKEDLLNYKKIEEDEICNKIDNIENQQEEKEEKIKNVDEEISYISDVDDIEDYPKTDKKTTDPKQNKKNNKTSFGIFKFLNRKKDGEVVINNNIEDLDENDLDIPAVIRKNKK